MSVASRYRARSDLAGHDGGAADRLIDRGYGRWLLAGGAVVGALALAGLTRACTVTQFYLCWGVIGATMSATLYEPCFAFVVRHLRINANHAIGLMTLVAGFASTIAFPLAAWLSQRLGLDAALLGFSLLMLGLGAPHLWPGAGSSSAIGRRPERSPCRPAVSRRLR